MSEDRRREWLDAMTRIAQPVMDHLAAGMLHEALPCSWHPDRRPFAMLEAFGRALQGIAPWLEAEGLGGEEAALQEHWREKTRQALQMAVDPASPDYMNFSEGYGQALVDAAFLAHGILRAPRQLNALLPAQVKEQLISALRATRRFTPFVSNWILFSAMVEAALQALGDSPDLTRVDYAVQMFSRWYLGDGTYGDGDHFHWDYYNSFVISPMLTDVVRVFRHSGRDYEQLLPVVLGRAGRYAQVLEQLIAPDGSWPVVGRSVTYRFGAFHALSHAALLGFLPAELPAPQVRCALTAAIRRIMGCPGVLDKSGWLQPGITACQPGLAEGYISVGSLYLCEAVFLPLGLPPEDAFWSAPDLPWTSCKIWSGQDCPCDHAVD